MMVASMARVRTAVRKGVVLVSAAGFALACTGPAFAEKAGRAGAPIVYAGAKPQGMSGPIDLTRPLATPISFGPAPAASQRDDVIPMALLTAPSPRTAAPATPTARAPDAKSSVATAEPYAGAPYQVDGKWYVPTHEPDYDEVGVASWYGPTFHGKASSSGEIFDQNALTAAHPTLPIPSLVRVTNLENGKSIVVRLNDRGPFVDDRIIDLSRGSAEALDVRTKGTARVRVQYVGPAPVTPNAVPPDAMMAEAPSAPMTPARLTKAPLSPADAFAMSTEPMAPLVPADAAWETRPAAPAAVKVRQSEDLRGVYLQAGSFSDLANAHRARERMDSYAPAFVTPATVNGSVFYRVMLGPWASRTEAERTQGQMTQSGAKTLIVAHLDR